MRLQPALGPLMIAGVLVPAAAADQRPAPPKAVVAGAAAAAAELSDAEIQAVAARVMVSASSYGEASLVAGLRELANREPRYAIPVVAMASRKPTEGVVDFPLHANNLVTGTQRMRDGIAGKRLPAEPASITWQLAAHDLDDGQYVTGYEAPIGIFTIRAENSQVTAWRRFGPPINSATNPFPGGKVVTPPNGSAIAGGNPLMLPQVGMAEVHTTVAAPLGGGAIEAWDEQIAAMHPNAHDPDVAFPFYRAALENAQIAYPKSAVVWTTMPLAASRNTLRNYFNAQVRAYAGEHGKPLLDIAAIQSTTAAGRTLVDAEGECSDPALATAGYRPQLNLEGAVRVARAWWKLQADLAKGADQAK